MILRTYVLFTVLIVIVLSSCKSKQQDPFIYDYYSNGRIMDKYIIRNGSIEDTSYSYYPNGVLSSKKTWKHNKLNGPTTIYYSSAKIKAEGYYQDSLKKGEWYYYDSLGNKERMSEYFILNNTSYPNNRFIHYNDIPNSFNYDVESRIDTVIGSDTLYDFTVKLKNYILKKVRVIYGMKNIIYQRPNSIQPDTIYSNNNKYVIFKINCSKTSNLLAEVQCYKDTTLSNGNPGIDAVNSFFLLVPESHNGVNRH